MLTRIMALRVLLADESVTIKKVFQLALQDYAAVVSTVTVGLDVLQVTQQFRPDIIFIDVILQKKNGYEVCQELKAHPQLSSIPVVLVWSGFMELDHAKYNASRADADLEKPFDAQRLREIVTQLVSKTKSQPLSKFLDFPPLPDFDEDKKISAGPQPSLSKDVPFGDLSVHSDQGKTWSMDSFAPPENSLDLEEDETKDDFLAVELSSPPPPVKKVQPPVPMPIEESDDNEAQWVQKTLSKYRLDPSKKNEQEATVNYRVPADKIDPDTFVTNTWSGAPQKKISTPEDKDDAFELDLISESESPVAKTKAAVGATLSEAQLTQIIRDQSHEVIEKVVWQIVPEVAARIIEREIERLLAERNKL